MNFPFFAAARPVSIASVSVALLVVACSKTTGTSNQCALIPPDAGLSPTESLGLGHVTGTGVNATLCNVDVTTQSYQGLQLLFGENSFYAAVDVTTPAGAVNGTLSGNVQVPTPVPGVYRSSDATGCGNMTFSYGTVPPGTDCTSDASGTCPAACQQSFTCPGNKVPCCLPLASTFVYSATASTCTGTTGPAEGSWTLTLTSVAASKTGGSGSSPTYTVHGSLAATLKGISGTMDTVDVNLSF